MQPGISEAQAVAAKRGSRRIASSTAKLDAILAEVRSGTDRQQRLESSIDKLADAVKDLAVSSVRYEEKVLQLEQKTTKEIAVQGEQLASLQKTVNDIKDVVDVLERQRQSQQYWFRKIVGVILVPVVVVVLLAAGYVYSTLNSLPI